MPADMKPNLASARRLDEDHIQARPISLRAVTEPSVAQAPVVAAAGLHPSRPYLAEPCDGFVHDRPPREQFMASLLVRHCRRCGRAAEDHSDRKGVAA